MKEGSWDDCIFDNTAHTTIHTTILLIKELEKLIDQKLENI